MNTESQSTVEIYHAHVADFDSVATVSTSKTQVFVKRFDGIDSAGWREKHGHFGHFGTCWQFSNSGKAIAFALKWK